MARKPRSKSPDTEQEIELLTALRFIAVAQTDTGTEYATHCAFREHDVIAFDGILAAGHPVVEQMAGCPHTLKLIAALSKVRGAYSMTLLDTLQLSINAGVFHAKVPCIAPVRVEVMTPDAPNYDIGDSWKMAAMNASIFCTDNADTVVGSAVLTQAYSVVGTNGKSAFIEALTGWNMPEGLIIPKAFVNAVCKVDHKLVKFGFSEGSITFWFENGAWIRTQLYQEQFPRVAPVLAMMDNPVLLPMPANIWSAIDACVPHMDKDMPAGLFFSGNQVRSHETSDKGAQYECEGLPFHYLIDPQLLKKCKDFIGTIDFVTQKDKVIFYGNNIRGLIMKKSWGDAK